MSWLVLNTGQGETCVIAASSRVWITDCAFNNQWSLLFNRTNEGKEEESVDSYSGIIYDALKIPPLLDAALLNGVRYLSI